jgi:lipopolysaccharide/colanic/teichoic acid biosynthesis glycosyltransferase
MATGLPIALTARVSVDPGPVLERQERIGPGGRRFQMLKFRTTSRPETLYFLGNGLSTDRY